MSVTFTTPDGGSHTIAREMAELSCMAKRMLEMYDTQYETPLKDPIPLLKVDAATLQRVVDWMRHRVNVSAAPQDPTTRSRHDNDKRYDGQDSSLLQWERTFFTQLNKKSLFGLLNAANYMEITDLIESGSTFVSEQIIGMSVEETRKYLGVQGDFTAAEEAEMKEKYDWLEKL